MGGIGEILRKTRTQKGLTLRDVEEETKIRAKYLESLENQEFDQIPGQAYIKGFIRGYAKFLDLDDNKLIEMYVFEAPPEEPEEAYIPSVDYIKQDTFFLFKGKTLFFLVTSVIAIGALIYFNNNYKERQTQEFTRQIQNDVNSSNSIGSNSPLSNTPEEEPTSTKEEEPNQTKDAPTNQQPIQQTTPAEQNNQGVNLQLHAKNGDCWLQVKADGEVIFTGTLKQGEAKNFEATEKISLIAGNAGALEITHNGNNLGYLGPLSKRITQDFTR